MNKHVLRRMLAHEAKAKLQSILETYDSDEQDEYDSIEPEIDKLLSHLWNKLMLNKY